MNQVILCFVMWEKENPERDERKVRRLDVLGLKDSRVSHSLQILTI